MLSHCDVYDSIFNFQSQTIHIVNLCSIIINSVIEILSNMKVVNCAVLCCSDKRKKNGEVAVDY